MKRNIEGYHRAKTMLPEIRELIVEAAISTDIKREALADALLIRIEKNYPKEIPPKIETIIKEISKARNRKQSPLEEPWHLGLLVKLREMGIPDFNADDIAAIFRVQHWLDKNFQDVFDDVLIKKKSPFDLGYKGFTYLFRTLTIRQAKWIAVLHLVTGRDTEYLWLASFYYSYHEIIAELSGTPYDTKQTDYYIYLGKATFYKMFKHLSQIEPEIFGDTMEKALTMMHNLGQLKGEDK